MDQAYESLKSAKLKQDDEFTHLLQNFREKEKEVQSLKELVN